jgi:hypothetical protein
VVTEGNVTAIGEMITGGDETITAQIDKPLLDMGIIDSSLLMTTTTEVVFIGKAATLAIVVGPGLPVMVTVTIINVTVLVRFVDTSQRLTQTNSGEMEQMFPMYSFSFSKMSNRGLFPGYNMRSSVRV